MTKFSGLADTQKLKALEIRNPKNLTDSKRGPGRPPGKHSNTDYTQTTVYLPKKLLADVKIKLIPDRGEMSGLIEGLLQEWLKSETD